MVTCLILSVRKLQRNPSESATQSAPMPLDDTSTVKTRVDTNIFSQEEPLTSDVRSNTTVQGRWLTNASIIQSINAG